MPDGGPGRVLVVGSLNEDLTCRVPAVPRPGETVLSAEPEHGCGGKGANQAVAAARAGAAVRMVGCVGSDPAGDRLLSALGTAGVEVSGVSRVPGGSGLAIVAVDADGENAIIVAAGANAACTPDRVAAGLAGLTAHDVVVAQGEVPLDAIVAAATVAAAAGARFVLNLAPPVQVDLAGLPMAVLVVNEHEAATLLGRSAGEPSAGEPSAGPRPAGWLADRLGTTVIITLGADGVRLAEPADDHPTDPAGDTAADVLVPAVVPERVVDTTGAGDAFVGALAAALAGGREMVEAVRWGAAAGSIAVAAVGAQGGRATPEAINRLLDAHDGPDRTRTPA